MIGTQQDSSPTWRNVDHCKDRAVQWCFDREDSDRRKLLSSAFGILEAARIERYSACGNRGRMNAKFYHYKQLFINVEARCSNFNRIIDALSSKSTHRTVRFGFCYIGAMNPVAYQYLEQHLSKLTMNLADHT